MHYRRQLSIASIIFGALGFVLFLSLGYYWWAGGCFIVYNFFLLYPSLYPYSQLYGPVMTQLRTNRREVWLTIDDGPSQLEPKLLELLEAYQVHATFFVVGERLLKYPKQTQQILEKGHQIGNHTMTHPQFRFWSLAPWQLRREIDSCDAVLKNYEDASHRLFRSPVGMKNIFLHSILKKRNMHLIGWHARGLDGSHTNTERIIKRLKRRICPRAIILIHTGHSSSLTVLKRTLEYLQMEGYRCIIPNDNELQNSI